MKGIKIFICIYSRELQVKKQTEVKLRMELEQCKSKSQHQQKEYESLMDRYQQCKLENKNLKAKLEDRNEVLRFNNLEVVLMEKQKEIDDLRNDNKLLYNIAKQDGRKLDKLSILQQKWPDEKEELTKELELMRNKRREIEIQDTKHLALLNKREGQIAKLNEKIQKLQDELGQYRNTVSRNMLERQNKILEVNLVREKENYEKQINRYKTNSDNDVNKMEKV